MATKNQRLSRAWTNPELDIITANSLKLLPLLRFCPGRELTEWALCAVPLCSGAGQTLVRGKRAIHNRTCTPIQYPEEQTMGNVRPYTGGGFRLSANHAVELDHAGNPIMAREGRVSPREAFPHHAEDVNENGFTAADRAARDAFLAEDPFVSSVLTAAQQRDVDRLAALDDGNALGDEGDAATIERLARL